MIFRRLYEDLGFLKASVKSMNEKQDMLLETLRRQEERSVRQAEFKLFKRFTYAVSAVICSAIAFLYVNILGGS
jgi:hypothetical protein